MKRKHNAKYILWFFQTFFRVRLYALILVVISFIAALVIWGRGGVVHFCFILQVLFSLLAFLFFFLGLPLVFFRNYRRYSGLAFMLAGQCFAAGLVLWSIALALTFAGILWTIVGFVFAGVGVVLVALVALLINGEYWTTAYLIGSWMLVSVFQLISAKLLGSLDILKLETEVQDFIEKDSEMIDRLVHIKSTHSPLIKDSRMLPAPKEQILKILEERELAIDSYQSKCIYGNAEHLLPILDEEFAKINGMDWFIEQFFEIEPDDVEDVTFINSNYSDPGDLINNHRLFHLWMKYS